LQKFHRDPPGARVRYAACEGDFVEEADVDAVLFERAELVVGVALLHVSIRAHDCRGAAAHIIVIEVETVFHTGIKEIDQKHIIIHQIQLSQCRS